MMLNKGEPRLALIHDELTRRGGAEIVFEELIRIFPQADIYTLYAGRPRISVDDRRYLVTTSFLQKFPVWFRRHPGRMLPFLPLAAEQFDFSHYDLVFSSASGFVKGVVTRSSVPQLCYCHTPTRYLWENAHDVVAQAPRGLRTLTRFFLHSLRLTDYAAAQRVTTFLANSTYTQARIATYYRRKSTVVHPPIDTAFFTPGRYPLPPQHPNRKYFLLVGRLTPLKYFDQAIRVCEKLRLPLIVVGKGQAEPGWRALAGRYTYFAGNVSPEKLRDYYRGALALLQPGVEDFGMASAEALACGTPVIAYGLGGVQDIVRDRTCGILYTSNRDEGLAEAIRQFLHGDRAFSIEAMQQSTLRFAPGRFRDAIYRHVLSTLESNH